MASRLTLREETERLVDDAANDRWSDSVINTYLDEAQTEFNRRVRAYKSTYSATSALNVGVYSFGTATDKPLGPIERLVRGSAPEQGIEMTRTTDYKMDRLFGTGWTSTSSATSDRWIQDIRSYDTVRVHPLPSSGSQTFHAFAAATPPALTGDSSVPVIPPQYHYALPFYGAYKCLLWNNDDLNTQLAEKYKQRFDEIVQQAILEIGAMYGKTPATG